MRMPNYLWSEAIRHGTYLINRITTRSQKDMTPYEVFRGKKPNISHLRIFGCIGYARVEKPFLKKLDDRSRMLVHLGTEPGSKAYRMLDPEIRRIIVSRNVVFDETKGWNWSDHEQSYEDFIIELGEFGNHGVKHENQQLEASTETRPNEEEDEMQEHTPEPEAEEEERVLRRSERQTRTPKYLEDYIMVAEEEGELLLLNLNEEPINFKEASEREEWIAACKDEIASIERNRVWDLVELPYGVKPIGLRWIFKNQA